MGITYVHTMYTTNKSARERYDICMYVCMYVCMYIHTEYGTRNSAVDSHDNNNIHRWAILPAATLIMGLAGMDVHTDVTEGPFSTPIKCFAAPNTKNIFKVEARYSNSCLPLKPTLQKKKKQLGVRRGGLINSLYTLEEPQSLQ